MSRNLLLPASFKRVGIVLLIPSLVLGILWKFFEFELGFLSVEWKKDVQKVFGENSLNFTDELAFTGIILGLISLAFAREKQEDEYISRNRLESLQWAVLINYGILLILTWLIHGLLYIDVMMYNMLTILIIFIIRFHYVLYRNKLSAE